MIFPRGEVVHKNLSTSFTDLSALISTLKLENFSGTIEIDFPDTKGVLLIDSGRIVDGEAKVDNGMERTVGEEAIHHLLRLANQKDGILNIYRLLPEQVVLLANNLRCEPLFRSLSTNFIHFDQLLAKLKEGRHNGFIEVMTKDHQPLGVLFLEGGETVEMFTLPKNGPAVFGRMSLQIFIENIKKQGALFNVYGREGSESQREEISLQMKEEGPIGAKGSERSQREIEIEVIKSNQENIKEILYLLGEFLSESERVVDSLDRKGTFLRLFKKSLIERSDQFEFLDPFAGDFDYRNGTIQLTREVSQEELVRGIVESFKSTLLYLEEEIPREKMVSLKLKAGIETFLAHHKNSLKKLNLETMLSSLLQ
ncbi:MAG: DUF2226 domain-containing protein [Thermodesulfobacteriota bacterium]